MFHACASSAAYSAIITKFSATPDSSTISASAAPTADPDGDGQNNLLEYLAGTDPTSAASAFTLSLAGKTVSFAPVTTGRTYSVEFATNLTTKIFTPLTGGTTVDNGTTRSITDNSPTNSARYYRVKISLP